VLFRVNSQGVEGSKRTHVAGDPRVVGHGHAAQHGRHRGEVVGQRSTKKKNKAEGCGVRRYQLFRVRIERMFSITARGGSDLQAASVM
jgi:hypothetical protein